MKTIKHLMLLFPLVFLIHDLEEILTVEQFELPVPIEITSFQFTIAFILLWIVVTWGCIRAANQKSFLGMNPVITFALIIAVFLVNGIGHILQSIIFWKYVPGVITAVVLLIPFCLFSLKQLQDEQSITKKEFVKLLLVGVILITPTILVALLIGKLLF
ncbi:HXXEE domain-containing protein [Ureibacillus sp. NPDC094379]